MVSMLPEPKCFTEQFWYVFEYVSIDGKPTKH